MDIGPGALVNANFGYRELQEPIRVRENGYQLVCKILSKILLYWFKYKKFLKYVGAEAKSYAAYRYFKMIFLYDKTIKACSSTIGNITCLLVAIRVILFVNDVYAIALPGA